MSDRFDKFTERAKKEFSFWRRRRPSVSIDNYIGTEHLLLGLVREGRGSRQGAQ